MTKENFLDKWIEALPLNSKDADRKEMAYDIDLVLKKQALSLVAVVGRSEQFYCYEELEYKNAKCEKQCKDCINFEKNGEQ